jgi:hypothetical protein
MYRSNTRHEPEAQGRKTRGRAAQHEVGRGRPERAMEGDSDGEEGSRRPWNSTWPSARREPLPACKHGSAVRACDERLMTVPE